MKLPYLRFVQVSYLDSALLQADAFTFVAFSSWTPSIPLYFIGKKWTPSITATKDHALSLAIKNSLRMCTGAFPTVAKNSGNRTVFKDDTVTFHSNVWPDLKVSSESALQPWVNSSREDAFIMEELLPLRPLERRPRQA